MGYNRGMIHILHGTRHDEAKGLFIHEMHKGVIAHLVVMSLPVVVLLVLVAWYVALVVSQGSSEPVIRLVGFALLA